MEHIINLPKINEDLAYFCGLILGDGSLPRAHSRRKNGKYQERRLISFFCNSLEFTNNVYRPLFKRLFGINPRLVEMIRPKRNILYNSTIESKNIYNFLSKNIGLTTGKKAKIAVVPNIPKKYHHYLLAGLLDTDGGKKGNGFGLSTASENLAKFCIVMFKKFNFSFHSCPWHYNNHTYHQIYIHKKDFHKFLKQIPLKNIEKINYLKSYAPVA